jgi:histidyl-tRNA synthetase
LLSSIVYFFKSLGFSSDDIGIKINSRKILDSVLETLKISEKDKVFIIIDKLDKTEEAVIIELLEQAEVSKEVAVELIKLVKSKSLDYVKKFIPENDKNLKEIEDLLKLVEDYDIKEWVIFDPSIVRGLSYYTGVVFEGFSKSNF